MLTTIIFISAISLFTLRILFFSIGAFRERKLKTPYLDPSHLPFVSVIVPARNEENNILRCINSINKSTYPKDRFEIIAVNDRSTDKTGEILQRLSEKIANLVVLNKKETNDHSNLKGKAGALQSGIDIAKGEIILLTDADCSVEPKWVETVTSIHADGKVGLSSSYTNMTGDRIFDKFQTVEWAYMHTMGTGGVGMGQPLGCYGNNMAMRRDAYDATGGYKNIKFSVTEDLALQRAVFKTGWKVRYITDPAAAVNTLPCMDFKEYLRQHHRWATGGMVLGWFAVFFVLTSALLWISILLSIITGQWLWFAGLLGTRLVLDYLLLAPSLFKLRQKHLIKWIIPSVFFFMFMELVTPFLLLNKNIVWKGQTFRKSS